MSLKVIIENDDLFSLCFLKRYQRKFYPKEKCDIGQKAYTGCIVVRTKLVKGNLYSRC